MGDVARHRGAASTALAGPLLGVPAVGRVMGASSGAAWLERGGEVMVLTGPGRVRLPNAFVVPGEPWRKVRPGDPVRVGGGRIAWAGGEASIGRWWDPRPVLPRVRVEALRLATTLLGSTPVDDGGLGRALATGDERTTARTAACLVGAGEGLTPLGDDVLTGAMAALVLLGEATGRAPLPVASALGEVVENLAPARTTRLSGSLLRCAGNGQVALPLAHLLAALCGRGSVGTARSEVLGIGHSSGVGLLAGIVAGVAALTGVLP